MTAMLVVAVILLLALLIRWGYTIPWTGFGEYTWTEWKDQKYQRAKTLWDWMQLLLIPIMIAVVGVFGAAWFNQRRELLARDLDERRHREEQELVQDRFREEALQKYLDSMAELMLGKGLRTSIREAEVRDIARALTLTVMQGLDGARKGTLLRFLKESKLIENEKPIISLNLVRIDNAQLRGADLRWADLHGAIFTGAELREAHLEGAYLEEAYLGGETDLRGAHLNKADLRGAIFTGEDHSGADLRGADLRGADLRGADLRGADLRGARNLTQGQLESARGDVATRLPEGLVRPAALIWSAEPRDAR
ncbi:MAG: pentapeptide repeat-containing protein [Planctomycetaceae bacterium]|nr:pentapeptide repeat-containing protein [Planctomycetaceae bacterium]